MFDEGCFQSMDDECAKHHILGHRRDTCAFEQITGNTDTELDLLVLRSFHGIKAIMAKMIGNVYVRGNKQYRLGMLLDTGASVTILKYADAVQLGLRCKKPTDKILIGGEALPVCYRDVSMQIENTDCLVTKMPVAVVTRKKRDLPISIAGVDFLQRAGAVLDQRKGRHAVFCDISQRDAYAKAGDVVTAKAERFRQAPPP